mmetsp:Transcript_114860/g.245215  ORF Transcript_114860/g.245215 Transcript_114860/m.245215 type:complete len:234 (-) Transcript_114860:133-834(-)
MVILSGGKRRPPPAPLSAIDSGADGESFGIQASPADLATVPIVQDSVSHGGFSGPPRRRTLSNAKIDLDPDNLAERLGGKSPAGRASRARINFDSLTASIGAGMRRCSSDLSVKTPSARSSSGQKGSSGGLLTRTSSAKQSYLPSVAMGSPVAAQQANAASKGHAKAPKKMSHIAFCETPNNTVHPITPYSKVYGKHPRFFDYNRKGEMQLNDEGIAEQWNREYGDDNENEEA